MSMTHLAFWGFKCPLICISSVSEHIFDFCPTVMMFWGFYVSGERAGRGSSSGSPLLGVVSSLQPYQARNAWNAELSCGTWYGGSRWIRFLRSILSSQFALPCLSVRQTSEAGPAQLIVRCTSPSISGAFTGVKPPPDDRHRGERKQVGGAQSLVIRKRHRSLRVRVPHI